jgi:hypothetical protein
MLFAVLIERNVPEGVRGVNHLAFGNGRDRIYHRSALRGFS